MHARLTQLEPKTYTLNHEEVKEISVIRAHLKLVEEIQTKQLHTFLKGWWKEREDWPIKEIFKTLKRKQDQDLLLPCRI